MQLNSKYNNNAVRVLNLLVSGGVQVVLKKRFHEKVLLLWRNTSNKNQTLNFYSGNISGEFTVFS
jgi:hypothetical protein